LKLRDRSIPSALFLFVVIPDGDITIAKAGFFADIGLACVLLGVQARLAGLRQGWLALRGMGSRRSREN